MSTKDVTVAYTGASGGHLLFHLLLLSGRYHCEFFKQGVDIQAALSNQWKIEDHKQWKSTEHWPNNTRTRSCQTPLDRIYLYCNPLPLEKFTEYPSRRIVLYTDIDSQFLLASYKNALWFYSSTNFSRNRGLLRQWNKFYNAIKDPQWPKCNSYRHIDQLPWLVQQEVLAHPLTSKYIGCKNWKDFLFKSQTKEFNGIKVYEDVPDLVCLADDHILLQDLINTQAEILVDKNLIHSVTDAHRQLIKHWLQLHPTQLLSQIGING